jgi:outer membrane lipoprotein
MRRIDLKRVIPVGLVALLVLCQACASVVPSEVRKRVDESITLEDLLKNPDAYLGRKVLWGGKVIKVNKPGDGIQFEVAAKELERSGIPIEKWYGPIQVDGLRDRFLLRHAGPLDEASYREARYLTTVGEVIGSEAISFGQKEFRYPVIRSEFLFFHVKPRVERLEKWSLDHLVGQANKEDFVLNLGLPTKKGQTDGSEVWEYFISYGRGGRADILPRVRKNEAYDDLILLFDQDGFLSKWGVRFQR